MRLNYDICSLFQAKKKPIFHLKIFSMAERSDIPFTTASGTRVNAWRILPETPRYVLHILHGMMEHSARYHEFAEWMAGQGFAVYSADLPGHGASVQGTSDLGHLEDESGWEEVIGSVRSVQDRIRREHHGLPVFLLGHSFGSVVARSFAQRHASKYPLAGLVLSGAMQQPPLLLHLGMLLTSLQKARHGQRHRSRLMIRLGYGQYAKYFAPNRSPFDWLSSRTKTVDDYDADPLCGYDCTLGYYRNFFRALLETWKVSGIRKMPSHLPVLLLGGSMDPAIRFGKDTRMLKDRYRGSGMSKVSIKLYPNGRHEMLNEVNRLEVFEFLREWMVGAVVSRQ